MLCSCVAAAKMVSCLHGTHRRYKSGGGGTQSTKTEAMPLEPAFPSHGCHRHADSHTAHSGSMRGFVCKRQYRGLNPGGESVQGRRGN